MPLPHSHDERPDGAGPRTRPLCIRELETAADYTACARLQRRVWGEAYREVVPASVMKVSREVGGICAGAFNGTGELIGFVYGLTGPRAGRLVHWSHMLAVDPAHRDRGVGRRLKRYQRSLLEPLGVSAVHWTFDPLVARNAHLNLNHLGVSIDSYVPDMYPGTGSDLHAFGTDRLVVSWPLESGGARRNGSVGWRSRLDEAMRPGGGAGESAGRDGGEVRAGAAADLSAVPVWDGAVPALPVRRVRLEIPSDAESMREGRLAELREWRASTRSGFTALLGTGWRVTGFERGSGICHYLLERPAD